jgi:hypothetical protein
MSRRCTTALENHQLTLFTLSPRLQGLMLKCVPSAAGSVRWADGVLPLGCLRAAGLQDQLRRVEKDRQDLLEICQGRLAGIQSA